MKFNNWINNEKYIEYHRHAFIIIDGIVKKRVVYLLNYQEREDIISQVFEALIIENIEITNEKAFKYGYFLNFVRNKTNGCLNGKHKKRLQYSKNVPYHPEYKSFKEPEFLSKFNKYPKIKEIVEEKFINGEKWEIIEKKYNVCSKTINKQIKQIMEGNYKEKEVKPAIERRRHQGVAKYKDGKIEKLYHNITAVEADNFDRTMVSRICNGKTKTKKYAGYEWEFISKPVES